MVDALDVLRRGAVVCIPTETSYGLAVDALNKSAVERLAHLKGRLGGAPMGLIACDLVQARSVAREWTAVAHKLASLHWPGPLTLVVPARDDLPDGIVSLEDRALQVGEEHGEPRIERPDVRFVGVRVSSHGTPCALARALGRPITATSANPAGKSPAMDIPQARAYFGDGVSHYIDDGRAHGGRPSTVVLIDTDGTVRVLREGPVCVNVPFE